MSYRLWIDMALSQFDVKRLGDARVQLLVDLHYRIEHRSGRFNSLLNQRTWALVVNVKVQTLTITSRLSSILLF